MINLIFIGLSCQILDKSLLKNVWSKNGINYLHISIIINNGLDLENYKDYNRSTV